MYCKNCGAKIEDDAKFCSVCGEKQEIIQQNAAQTTASVPQTDEEIINDFDGNVYAASKYLHLRDGISMGDARKRIRSAKPAKTTGNYAQDRFNSTLKKVLIVGGSLIIVLCIIVAIVNRFNKLSSSLTSSVDTVTTTKQITTQPTTKVMSEQERLRAELKDKYGINKPLEFHEDFSTDEFRYVVISDSTPPSSYAVKYAKAYMEPGDIHYICNLFLNTTTKIWFEDLLLEDGDYTINVTVHEYEYLEEMDIHSIGGGMLLTEQYFSYNTGKEFSVEIDESAEKVSQNELIEAVKKIVTETYDEITDQVSYDGKNLYIRYNYSKAYASSPFLNATDDVKKQCAEGDCGDIASTILDLDDKYTNTWETITIDCGSLGKAVFDKSMIVNHGWGNYFEYEDGELLR